MARAASRPSLRRADAPSARAWLDRDTMHLGETVTLNVEAQGSTGGQPDFSALSQDFNLLGTQSSQQVSIVNGAARRRRCGRSASNRNAQGRIAIPALTLGSAKTAADHADRARTSRRCARQARRRCVPRSDRRAARRRMCSSRCATRSSSTTRSVSPTGISASRRRTASSCSGWARTKATSPTLGDAPLPRDGAPLRADARTQRRARNCPR